MTMPAELDLDGRRRVESGPGGRMMSRAAMAVLAALFFGAVSGCAGLAKDQGTDPIDARRRECERKGGYWSTAADMCRIDD
jgi:hypothetical protein